MAGSSAWLLSSNLGGIGNQSLPSSTCLGGTLGLSREVCCGPGFVTLLTNANVVLVVSPEPLWPHPPRCQSRKQR